MYKSISYEEILQRMLDRVPSTMDKREGSIIYDALAPAAVELQLMYIDIENILNETFADTASREYLIRRAIERDLSPFKATYAILKGVFNMDIAIGTRFSCKDLNYKIIGKINDHNYKLECETVGVAGNNNFGDLIPIDYIEGLEYAKLTELLIPGEDEEATEEFRRRYFKSFNAQAYGGNITDYKEKVDAIQGVGGLKVTPVWNGGGTVKLTIIDSNYNVPTDELINKVQNEIDPTQNSGLGVGIAPIGHIVTVVGVKGAKVNLTAKMILQDGWSLVDVMPSIEDVIDKYYNDLSNRWADTENLIVRTSQIETRILDVSGVIDIFDATINGLSTNLMLGPNEIPVRGLFSATIN